jgi:hypothetical protein
MKPEALFSSPARLGANNIATPASQLNHEAVPGRRMVILTTVHFSEKVV